MANIYTWAIEAMDCVPQKNDKTDVVVTVHWRQNATNGQYSGTVYGTVGLTYTPGLPFTSYANLKQDQVIGWVQDALGVERCAQIRANLDQQIADQICPPLVSKQTPWNV